MSDPVLDNDAEADQVSVQAVPGAVFLRMRRECADGSIRRMFLEMTPSEAVLLYCELQVMIRVASENDTPI
jgi:hypothetical protein